MTQRIVFDTNVVVSALLFSKGSLSWLRFAWRDKRCTALISKPTTAELIRVLAYPKFQLSATDRETLLGDFLPYTQVVVPGKRCSALPVCRDPNDQMFLELAFAGKAQMLVTGDADLLSMADACPFRIISPADEGFRLLVHAPEDGTLL